MAQNGDNGLVRLKQLEAPRKRDDQLDPFDQANSVTEEDFKQFVLSQLHLILDGQSSFWFNRPARSIKDLAELSDQNAAAIAKLLIGSGGGGVGADVEEELLGVKDGENRIFKTSKPFQNKPGTTVGPKVFHNGRRIFQGKEFRVLDSGLSSGYDTIHMLSFSPMQGQSVLTVDYTPTVSVELDDTFMGLRSVLGSIKNP